ncbi:MAG: hypothetical protein OEW75_12640 [Cyclobacteriaceae bacterium]|nr:hypothetical protein [Cyclobacteriaceae bacterium]
MSIGAIVISILITVALTTGWGLLQFLAKRMGTKNHIDHGGACGKGCMCGGGTCEIDTHP